MATLGDHRSNFTWALNKYNRSDDPDIQSKFARYMAKYMAQGLRDGFTVEQITQGKNYPTTEIAKHSTDVDAEPPPALTEQEARKEIVESVDTADVIRIGNGGTFVYAYGYRCCPDRLKVGCTGSDTLQRIADQIGTSTPDKPVLYVEIKTNDCRGLERAIHAVLRARGCKVGGGGDEWFKASRDEVLAIYQFINPA
jgi:hypothetical protein